MCIILKHTNSDANRRFDNDNDQEIITILLNYVLLLLNYVLTFCSGNYIDGKKYFNNCNSISYILMYNFYYI